MIFAIALTTINAISTTAILACLLTDTALFRVRVWSVWSVPPHLKHKHTVAVVFIPFFPFVWAFAVKMMIALYHAMTFA